MDFPVSFTFSMPRGVKIPWLMALFRNRTFAGSTKMEISGRRLLFTSTWTPPLRMTSTAAMNGPKLLDDPACERAHDHGAHQHGVLGAAYHTDGGDDADDGSSVAADHLTALVSDQDRKNVGKHRADHAAQLLIREPAGGDEQCGEKSPRDECADVRHDHSA